MTLSADLARESAYRAIGTEALEAIAPLDVRFGLMNAVAAAVFVAAGALMAPGARRLIALLLYALGACIAYVVLETWWFPEGHPRAYEPSHAPLVLLLLGGLAGTVAVFRFRTRRVGTSTLGAFSEAENVK